MIVKQILILLCSTLGPIIAAIGSLLLAYDVFSGPRRWYKYHKGRRERLAAIDHFRNFTAKNYSFIQDQGIDESERAKRVDLEFVQQLDDAVEKFDADELADTQKGAYLGIIGFLMIAIGSFMQAVSAILNYL